MLRLLEFAVFAVIAGMIFGLVYDGNRYRRAVRRFERSRRKGWI